MFPVGRSLPVPGGHLVCRKASFTADATHVTADLHFRARFTHEGYCALLSAFTAEPENPASVPSDQSASDQ